MIQYNTPGIEVWFQDNEGNVFDKALLPTFPRVGEFFWIQYEKFEIIEVEWSSWMDASEQDEYGKPIKKWVVKVRVDISPQTYKDLNLYGVL